MKEVLSKTDVKKGDFFILASNKGYRLAQQKEPMQVMECWDKVMTVKSKNGCITKEYEYFEKVLDLSIFKVLHKALYFEDNRSNN